MLTQINEKKSNSCLNNQENDHITDKIASDYLIDEKIEEQRFLVDEKKMKMIQLESKINALGAFNSKNYFYD